MVSIRLHTVSLIPLSSFSWFISLQINARTTRSGLKRVILWCVTPASLISHVVWKPLLLDSRLQDGKVKFKMFFCLVYHQRISKGNHISSIVPVCVWCILYCIAWSDDQLKVNNAVCNQDKPPLGERKVPGMNSTLNQLSQGISCSGNTYEYIQSPTTSHTS